MNKLSDLTPIIVNKYGLSQQDAEHFVATMFQVVDDTLQNGDKQVKIKGLGTFKLTNVSSRESINVNTGKRFVIEGRSKISFTPDSTMKDRVNQPFGQFDTVILNEGVTFDEIENEIGIEQINEDYVDNFETIDQQNLEEVTKSEALCQNNIEDDPLKPNDDTVSYKQSQKINYQILHDNHNNDVVNNEGQNSAFNNKCLKEGIDDSISLKENNSDKNVFYSDKLEHNNINNNTTINKDIEIMNNKNNKLVYVLLAVVTVIIIIGTYGVYYYQNALNECNNRILELEIVIDDINTKINNKTVFSEQETVKIATTNISKDTISKIKENELPKQVNYSVSEFDENEFNKDPRIRTGAYRIIGVDQTLILRKGQTLRSISDMILGPGMVCYIEALNPKKNYIEGDSIRVPKLKLKHSE